MRVVQKEERLGGCSQGLRFYLGVFIELCGPHNVDKTNPCVSITE
jgi:hypothetical protein